MLFGTVEFPHRIRWLPLYPPLQDLNFERKRAYRKLGAAKRGIMAPAAIYCCGCEPLVITPLRTSARNAVKHSSAFMRVFWRSLASGSRGSPSVPSTDSARTHLTEKSRDWMSFSGLAVCGSLERSWSPCCIPQLPIRLCPNAAWERGPHWKSR